MTASTVDPIMTLLAPVAESRDCWCEYVDIGVGSQRVTEDPDCPVHTPMGFVFAVVGALQNAGLLKTLCQVCGKPSGDLPECVGCTVTDETEAKRKADL